MLRFGVGVEGEVGSELGGWSLGGAESEGLGSGALGSRGLKSGGWGREDGVWGVGVGGCAIFNYLVVGLKVPCSVFNYLVIAIKAPCSSFLAPALLGLIDEHSRFTATIATWKCD